MAFDAVSTIQGGPTEIIRDFWSDRARNLICLGDSILTANGLPARLWHAILRTWDHPAGWDGIHHSTYATVADCAWQLAWENRDVDQRMTVGVDAAPYTAACLNGHDNEDAGAADDYYFGLPIGGHSEWWPGKNYSNNNGNGWIYRHRVDPNEVPVAAGGAYLVDDWWSTQDMNAQILYLYRSSSAGIHDGYPTDFEVWDNTSQVTGSPFTSDTATDPAYAHEDIEAVPAESGINMLPAVPVDTSAGNIANSQIRVEEASVSGSWAANGDALSFVELGVKYTGGPGDLFACCLAEDSWDLADHATAGVPDNAPTKRYRDIEIIRWLDLMFTDKSSPLYVLLWIAPEDGTVANKVTALTALCDRYVAAWQSAGGSEVRFIFIGSYRTDTNARSLTQCEAMYNVAVARNDTFFLSLYALMGGILWDAGVTAAAQLAWAEDASRGWDAIAHSGAGTPLDVSDADCVGGAGNIHPADADSSFFFAYVVATEFAKIASKSEKSIGGSGYMGMSHAGLVQPPRGW